MTITYTSEVADCKGFGCFWKLLFRWRGSIYKLVWRDLLAYSVCYYTLSFVYRFALDEFGRRKFEEVSLYMQYFTELIPIAFVLGFYVSIVVQRWWAQFENLPWPDSLSLYITTFISGNDDKGRMMRRTIVRYANLCFAFTLIMISPRVKKRFPSLDHLVEAGLLTVNEKKIFEHTATKTPHPTYWMPLVWAGTIVSRARKEGRIRDDFAVKTIIDEINRLRGLCGSLLGYDWISVPLVYTQVVTLAVYTFFVATLMGRQFLDPVQKYDKHHLDLYFPVFTYLQFFFYMGWLKVAESLVNPFGEDDDDFEVNWLIDRNVQVAYLIVDEMHNEHPELIQDIYWDEVFPAELPYTIAAQEFRMEPPQGSTANIEVPMAEQEILPTVDEKDELGEESFDSLEKMEQGKETSTSYSGREQLRRMGSNLSSILSGIHPKASIRNFLGTNPPMRRPHSRRTLSRIASKSSSNSTSPRHLRVRTDSENQASDYSFSGSEEQEFVPSSSQESVNTNTARRKKRQRGLGRMISLEEDGPIVINIKRPGKDPIVIQTDSNANVSLNNGDSQSQGRGFNKAELRNTGSFSSIQTSIFKDENGMQEEPLLSAAPDRYEGNTQQKARKTSIKTNRAPQGLSPPRTQSKAPIGRSVSTSGPLENILEISDDATVDLSRRQARHHSLTDRPVGPQLLGLSSSFRQNDSQKSLLSNNIGSEEAQQEQPLLSRPTSQVRSIPVTENLQARKQSSSEEVASPASARPAFTLDADDDSALLSNVNSSIDLATEDKEKSDIYYI